MRLVVDRLRKYRAMQRVGRNTALAYRGELLLWVLTTTMPLVLLALWTTVARSGAVGRFDEKRFVAWFLAAIVVRTATMSWVIWDIDHDIRYGLVDRRLLRPMNVLASYVFEALGASPVRLSLAVPIALATWFAAGERLTRDPVLWAIALLSLAGAAVLTVVAMCCLGAVALRFKSAMGVHDLWLAGFFVFSGYAMPLELLPPRLAAMASLMPFRLQLALPIEAALGLSTRAEALRDLGLQCGWIAVGLVVAHVLWSRGVRLYTGQGG